MSVSGIVLPTLTEYDPVTHSEGALDPLGLYAIADSLATKLVPGIRERMSHPRFLTAMAAGAFITREFEDEEIATDGQSEPWMVYEWYIVEGLVRSKGNDPDLRELPGVRKAQEAIRDGVRLSAARYLKTATVFGFHGIYRPFAYDLDIVRDGIPGENGYELISAWEKEQGLAGFTNGVAGSGVTLRGRLFDAVKDGLAQAHVARGPQWSAWSDIGEHFFPNRIPPAEARVLARALSGDSSTSRSQVVGFLSSADGQAAWLGTKSEREFHRALMPHVDADVASLIEAIMAYERFARLLQDAFDDCLFSLTRLGGKVKPAVLAQEKGVKMAHKGIQDLYYEVGDKLSLFGETIRFEQSFSSLLEPAKPEEWVTVLFERHKNVQRNKPPRGKNPWLEQFDDGSAVIRPIYRRDNPGRHDDSYVHMYRTAPLQSFLLDLRVAKKISPEG
jgi:hypothetical protein